MNDIVKEWAEQRQRRADGLRFMRRNLGPDLTRRFLARNLEHVFGVPPRIPKPTVENLLEAARIQDENAAFWGSRIGALDTEYYSADGWDDCCVEAADARRRFALDLRRSAVRLAFCSC